MVLFDQATYDKLLTEAPKYKLITPSVLSDRLRVILILMPFLMLWYRFAIIVINCMCVLCRNACYVVLF